MGDRVWAVGPDGRLCAALARGAEQRAGEFNAQDIANTACAFAKLDQLDDGLFAALARGAEQRMGEFSAQAIVNTA